ncbi:MAG TPA: class I SAM-dependent methyltransferase [Polyangiales bacterium]|nr:class I SAM-dependent methyltransferase [Polyangiales bacterium]
MANRFAQAYKRAMSDALQHTIERLQRDARVWRSFAARAAASEQLDAACHGAPAALQLQAAELQRRLDAADERFVHRLRERIRSGRYTADGVIRGLARHAAAPGTEPGYDALDVLLASVLDAGELPAEQVTRELEMVAYQPAPGRVILQLLPYVGAHDLFYDLGSGLGRVVILVALLRGARARGVELEPEFCAYAERAARSLQARGASFTVADARDVSLDDGTVFFLYTPFRGTLLGTVLAKLRAVAARTSIRVCSFGPCTPEIAAAPWLVLRAGAIDADELAVFESRS